MTFPTLTPEIHAYCVAIVAVFALSTTSLASKMQDPSGGNVAKLRFMLAHLALLAAVALFAAAILGVPRMVPDSLSSIAGLTCAGVALGIVAVLADRAIIRSTASSGRPWRRRKIRASALSLGILTAFLEEVLYRGYLVALCQKIPSTPLHIVALASTVLAFAAAHIYAGPAQALAKLPLGSLTLAAVLFSNALLPAIVAHVLFNVLSTEELSRERDQVVGSLTRTVS